MLVKCEVHGNGDITPSESNAAEKVFQLLCLVGAPSLKAYIFVHPVRNRGMSHLWSDSSQNVSLYVSMSPCCMCVDASQGAIMSACVQENMRHKAREIYRGVFILCRASSYLVRAGWRPGVRNCSSKILIVAIAAVL